MCQVLRDFAWLKHGPHLIRITCWSVVKYMKTDLYRLYGQISCEWLLKDQQHILLCHCLKNLSSRIGSKFWELILVHLYPEKFILQDWLKISSYNVHSSNSGCAAGPSRVTLNLSVHKAYTKYLFAQAKSLRTWHIDFVCVSLSVQKCGWQSTPTHRVKLMLSVIIEVAGIPSNIQASSRVLTRPLRTGSREYAFWEMRNGAAMVVSRGDGWLASGWMFTVRCCDGDPPRLTFN